MGCTASKLDNEDTVRRCKERRRLMKEAVYARHHLAAAHSDYCRSLRITGSALTAFASGEPFSVSDQTPAVFLRTPSSVSRASTIPPPAPPPRLIPSPSPSVHPQPPPPPAFSPSLSPTIASSKLPHILTPQSQPPSRRHRKPIKLPHILSESSISSSPKSHDPARSNNYASNYAYNANSTYSSTPSQASSVWNWENFYPPSPPDSEFFHRLNNDGDRASTYSNFQNHHTGVDDDKASTYSNYQKHHNPHQIGVDYDKASTYSNYQKHHNPQHIGVDDEKASTYPNYQKHHNPHQIGVDDDRASTHSNYQKHHNPHQIGVEGEKASAYSNYQKHHSHHIEVDDEEETEREEVQYSEWDDHYNTTTSSEEEDNDGDRDSRSEMGTRSNFESSVHIESKIPPVAGSKFPTVSKSDDAESSVSWNAGGKGDSEISDMKIVVRHRNLAEIVAALKENFDKAASAGEQVSELLETSRAQLDRSFRQLKKTVYHSSGVFSNLSSSWSSKPPLAVKYRLEPGSMEEPDGQKSLCSTLERLLAWEKKLYQEVKAREGVKIEHEKKLSVLQSQEYRGDDEAKLDKTKAAINKLHSLIVVTSQAVTTTSSAIIGLRDSELVPQLSNLCHGFMYMWRSMNKFHEVQSDIVQQVRGLVNRSANGGSTSDLHRQATRDLESAVSAWHSSFCRLVKFQRELIRSLNGWFRLTLLPVNSEPTNTNREHSAAFSFFDEWKLALDRIPDTVASEAIKSFINVVHSISMKQAEEVKIKKRTESASKELEKKASSLRNIERKYYHSYSMVGIGLPDTGPNNGHALDARDPLAEKKLELTACQRRVEEEISRHSKAVEVTRAMTLNNIQTGLPGVFQAMTSFSALIVEALETVCTRSYDMSR